MTQTVDGGNFVVSLDNPDERSDKFFCLQETWDAQVVLRTACSHAFSVTTVSGCHSLGFLCLAVHPKDL